MKNSKELAYYTGGNSGAMQEWYNREYKHTQNVLNTWLKDYRISSKKDNELVRDIAAYDLEGDVIFQNYIRALLKCREEYTMDTVTGAVDIVLQEMAEKLSEHMRRRYPCLQTHYVIMRANKSRECVMYIGPFYMDSETACRLFGDGGVFMTQGLAACNSLFGNIGFFQ